MVLPCRDSVLENPANPEDTFMLYRLSYYYYTLLGAAIVLVVGVAVSLLTGPLDPRTVNRDLLSPAIHSFLPPAVAEPEQKGPQAQTQGEELIKLARC